MNARKAETVTLALTGASGMPYAIRLLECLISAEVTVYLLYSRAAQIVARQEMDLTLPTRTKEATEFFSARFGAAPGQLQAFGREDWFAPVASGSNPADAMVVCPCTM
jgi:flavin prenyltransferase